MANGESRFDGRITMGNIITIALVLAGLVTSYVRSESRAETMDQRLTRMEGKMDYSNDQLSQQRIDIEVLKEKVRQNGRRVVQ